MQVPNLSHVVRDLADSFGPLTSPEKCGQFLEIVVPVLHAHDRNFGHLRKMPGQTHYNGHAVDVTLYKATGQAVDLIGGSKIASPATPATITWGVEEEARYTDSEKYWIAPMGLPPGDEDEEGDVNPPKPKPPVVEPTEPQTPVCQCAEVLEAVDAVYAALNLHKVDMERILGRMETAISAQRQIEMQVPGWRGGKATGTLESPA